MTLHFHSRAARLAAWIAMVAGLTAFGPAIPMALGHSQLVTSVPAAGEVTEEAPREVRLIFSEAIEARYTSLDVLDAGGRLIARAVGDPDPADPYALVAPVSGLADGLYTVEWRALSAADGHATSGFLTFGIGNVEAPQGGGSSTGPGSIHGGHDEVTTFIETESRIVGNLGLLLAFGLPIVSWLVLRDPHATGLAKVAGGSLALATTGAAGLVWVGASGIDSDAFAYAAGSRTGQLLAARIAIALVGAVATVWLASRRPSLALVTAAVASLVGLVLVAIGGHAAAYDAPAPAATIVVHLVAAAIWLAGLLTLAWLAIADDPGGPSLATLVPRFSGLALVSVGLLALTGAYSDWVQTRALVALDTPYGTTLAVKIMLALVAFGIGAFNFRSGGRPGDRRLRPRLVAESGFALAIVVATGVLASGSPPAQSRPIAIGPVPSSLISGALAPTLDIAPGRPGPSRFVVRVSAPPQDSTVELQLQRLDDGSETRLAMRTTTPGVFESSGLLPAGSRWDASVVVRHGNGAEASRTRFAFGLDGVGINEGRATPVLDPATIVAVLLLVVAVLGAGFTLGGGTLPRVEARVGRVALLAGSTIGAVLGVVALVAGPRL